MSTQTQALRVGVIGLGVMGSRHARVCRALPKLDLLAVCDVQQDRAERVGADLGVPGYTDYRELLAQPGLQAVVVAVSDQFHREPCELAAAKGLDIFLEKPIATTQGDAEAIVAATDKAGVKLMVNHTLHYEPRYVAVQRAVADGKLGDIIHVYARRNATTWSAKRIEGRAEVVVFHGVHDIGYLEWMLGSTVTRVYAERVSKALTDLGVADTIMATLRFANGAIGLLEQSWALPYPGLPTMLDSQLEVVGTAGAAYLELRDESVSMLIDGQYTQPGLDTGTLERAYERFIDYCAGRAEPVISGRQAVEALRVADAIVRSAKRGQPIDL